MILIVSIKLVVETFHVHFQYFSLLVSCYILTNGFLSTKLSIIRDCSKTLTYLVGFYQIIHYTGSFPFSKFIYFVQNACIDCLTMRICVFLITRLVLTLISIALHQLIKVEQSKTYQFANKHV